MTYAIITAHVFTGSKPYKKTPVECVTRTRISAAMKAARESARRHKCPHHPNTGLTVSLVKDEDDNTVGGYVAYRDGEIKELKKK